MSETANSPTTHASPANGAAPACHLVLRDSSLPSLDAALPEGTMPVAPAELAAGIMHDFNNYMQIAIGSLEGMRRRMPGGRILDVSDRIETALRSLEAAAALAQRLVTSSAPCAPNPQPTAVNAVILAIEGLLRCALGRQGELDLRLGRDLPSIRCDRVQLESALVNLTINGRDAMPHGGRLSIETALMPAAGAVPRRRYVGIRVADTGCGMTATGLMRAFEPFHTTKPAGRGKGLGLPRVRRFVDQLGGRIEIESAVGRGTSVTLLLPC